MRIEFNFNGAKVVSEILLNRHLPYRRDNMPFVVRGMLVDGVDIFDEEDCDLSELIAHYAVMSHPVYDQLEA